MGRKPLPTATKELNGNPGKRALNSSEPRPARLTKAPICPDFLHGLAREQWQKMSPQLLKVGVLTSIDLDALARYCLIYQRWRETEERIAKTGGPVLETADGNYYQNPYLAVANKCNEQLNSLASEFGLTPSSRSKVHAEPPDETSKKKLENELFGGQVRVKKQ